MVSRDFLITQAVLNAASIYSPHAVKYRGVAGWLREMDYLNPKAFPMFEATRLYELTIDQFHKLTSQYAEAAA